MFKKQTRSENFSRSKKIAATILVSAILPLPGPVHTSQEQFPSQEQLLHAVERRLGDSFFGAIMVSKNGEIIYRNAFGLANVKKRQANMLSHRFRIGSITKTFTAALIKGLSDEGALSLNDSVSRYIPGIPNGEKITILHLLEHKSGLRDFSQADWKRLLLPNQSLPEAVILQMIREKKPRRKPGRKFEYNNAGYILLGFVVERVSGKTYLEMLSEKLLEPLALKNTGFSARDSDIAHLSEGHNRKRKIDASDYDYTAIAAAGGLYSDLADLKSWCAFQQRKNTKNIGWRRGDRFGYSAAWHTGNTNDYSALLVQFPEVEGCYIVLSNRGGVRPPKEIRRTIPEIFFKKIL